MIHCDDGTGEEERRCARLLFIVHRDSSLPLGDGDKNAGKRLMDRMLFNKLSALPRLDRVNMQTLSCKVCGGKAEFFDVVDFNKCCSETEVYAFGASGVAVDYFRCSACGFMFTPFFDEWTTEEFARFVYNDDYIYVDGEYAGPRPEREAAAMALRLAGETDLRILDYGSGTGLFASYMRKEGYRDVVGYDPFSSPTRPNGRFDLVTCFEVVEHSTTPLVTLADIASMLDPGGCIILSTGIQPVDIGSIRASWWYIAPRNGHASIHTLDSLAIAGQEVGLTLYSGPTGVAFASADPTPKSLTILSTFGAPYRFLLLASPDQGSTLSSEQRACWHDAELEGSNFYRWTRESTIVWRLKTDVLEPCRLTLKLPLHNEVREGFANACRFEVGGKSVACQRKIGELGATFSVDVTTEAIIKLITPRPLRPRDIGGVDDNRFLGLAILTTTPQREKND